MNDINVFEDIEISGGQYKLRGVPNCLSSVQQQRLSQ